MRLIDADALMDGIYATMKSGVALYRVPPSAIDNAPSVDAVPIVRCKDCEYFNDLTKTSLLVNGEHVKAGWCDRRARWNEEYRMLPDDFCSYGRRREY